MTKRITAATLKSFIKKNSDEIYIKREHICDERGNFTVFSGRHGTELDVFEKKTIDLQDVFNIDGLSIIPGASYYFNYDEHEYIGYKVTTPNKCKFVIATKKIVDTSHGL